MSDEISEYRTLEYNEKNQFVSDTAQAAMKTIVKNLVEIHPEQRSVLKSRIIQHLASWHFNMVMRFMSEKIEEEEKRSAQKGNIDE